MQRPATGAALVVWPLKLLAPPDLFPHLRNETEGHIPDATSERHKERQMEGEDRKGVQRGQETEGRADVRPLLGEAGKWTERGSPDDPWGSLKKGLPAMAIQLVRGLR